VAYGYRYTLERREGGPWLVRIPKIPEALGAGETEEQACANAVHGIIAALQAYTKAGQSIPLGDYSGDRIVLPSPVTAKLALHIAMQEHAWPVSKLANELGTAENTVHRLLDLQNSSNMQLIGASLALMKKHARFESTSPVVYHRE
jgi:predicted RNase H-like HicB family nuclease